MINKQSLEKIKKTTEEFLKKMTIEADVEVGSPKENIIPINIKTAEPQILIGEKGQTLFDIQRLLKLIFKKQFPVPENEEDKIIIDLDIQDYKKKKAEYLKEMARSIADEVVLTKKEKELPLMTAYERRIIHAELSGREDIKTESVGEEPERRVVIKPSV